MLSWPTLYMEKFVYRSNKARSDPTLEVDKAYVAKPNDRQKSEAKRYVCKLGIRDGIIEP